jgi:hypothetical protein
MRGREEVSTADIAQAIARSRARIAHTLSVLDREYALRHLFVRGTRMLRHPGDLGGAALRERIHSDVLPLALIGVGLAWLTLVGRQEGAQLGRRLADGLAHLQALARELVAFAAAPPGEGSVAPKSPSTPTPDPPAAP